MFQLKKTYRTVFLAIFWLMASNAKGQYVTISDTLFANFLCKFNPANLDYSCRKLDTTLASKCIISNLDFSHNSINSVNEIIYFKNTYVINGHANNISTFPTLNSTLLWQQLDFSYNKLKSFPDLSPIKNTLVKLNLSRNKLATVVGIEKLVKTRVVDLSHNQLHSFPDISNIDHDNLNLSHNYLSFKYMIPYTKEDDFASECNFDNQYPLTPDKKLSFYETSTATITVPIDEGVPGITYTWYKDSTIYKITSVNQITIPNIQKSDSGTYWVLVNSNNVKLKNITLSSGLLKIQVLNCQDILAYNFDTKTDCEQSSATLASITLNNSTWPFAFYLENSVTQDRIPIQSGQSQIVQNGYYHLIVDDGKGCIAKKANVLVLSKAAGCPAVFSPNGDGVQDILFVEGQSEANIVNKDGVIVKMLNLPTYWDGTDSKGQQVPMGSYAVIKKDGTSEKITVLH